MLKKLMLTAMAAGLVLSVSPQETEAASSSKVTVKVSALNVRAKASVKSTKVGTVYKNQTLTYKGRVGAWKKVSYKGKTRYVYGSYVGTKARAKKAAVKAPSKGSYKMTMNTSAYTPYCAGCSGITASGINVKKSQTYKGYKIIAAPRQFKIGTKMYIPGFGHAIVQDRGGAIVGNKLDLLVSNNAQAYKWGRKNVTVTIYR